MKLFNKYMLVALLGGIALTSCSDDDDYTAGPSVDPDCQGAYFSANNTYDYELDPEASTSFTLTVERTNTANAATINIEVLANSENVFEIPESVSFDAGQSTATITLSFPNAEIGTSYGYELKLEEGSYNPYADQTAYVSGEVLRIRWLNFTAKFNDDWMGLVDSPVTVQRVEGQNRWRVVDPYAEVFTSQGLEYDYEHYAQYINFTVNTDQSVTFETFVSDVYSDGSQIYGFWPLELDASLTAEAAQSKALDSYNVQLAPYYYIPGLGGFGVYTCTITLDKNQGEDAVFGDFGELPADAE